MNNSYENKRIEKILPSDVRYALQYKEGNLNKNDLEVLAMSNFENEAIYLSLKNLAGNPQVQKELLEKYVNQAINKTGDKVSDKKNLQQVIIDGLKINPNIEVSGVILAQISRQGFDFWQDKFKELATSLSKDKRDVFLLAHSTFIGLNSFVEAFSKENKNLYIIVPTWIKNKSENIGYNVKLANNKADVEYLTESSLKNESILVDDTVNTGGTSSEIQEFWKKEGLTLPEVISIVKNSKSQ